MINILYKGLRKIIINSCSLLNFIITWIVLKGNKVVFTNFNTNGIPYIMVAMGGTCKIGKNFSMNNGIEGNPIGCYDRCTFFVDKGAMLSIGDNVGISQTALICHFSIFIGNYVKIGGGVKIYDTDFHSLNYAIRGTKEDLREKIKAEVRIEDHVFIGAYSIILKGITIGEHSIVGAGSVVTKSIPPNQIWAGNPAKFIRNL